MTGLLASTAVARLPLLDTRTSRLARQFGLLLNGPTYSQDVPAGKLSASVKGHLPGVGVGVAVGVGVSVPVEVGVGDGPTRTTICAGGPRLPWLSRKRTVRIESPMGKAAGGETKSQNCTTAFGLTNLSKPEPSVRVHAVPPVKTWKRHAKSVSASVIVWLSGEKSGGLIPGTPPPPWEAGPLSQTVALPFPMSRVPSICRSGRLLGGIGTSDVPARPPPVGMPPSTTMTTSPEPRSKICRPCASKAGVGVGVMTQKASPQQKRHPSDRVRPKNTTGGPLPLGVGVGVGMGLGCGDNTTLTLSRIEPN